MSEFALRPVVKRSTEDRSTEMLRAYILSGAVKPGARLTEQALSDQLGVARATVRMSLHRLIAEGIVELTPYTGWRVTSLDEQAVWELWTLRGSLEGLGTKLAAERISVLRPIIQTAADDLIAACSSADVDRASECDFALHRTIIDSVSHARLASQYRQVEQQIRLYIKASNMLVKSELTLIARQHDALLDALFSGDAVRAAEEAWRHNQTEGEKLCAWIGKLAQD